MTFLDTSIALVIVLFILSIMTEKLVRLIKDYPLVFNITSLLISIALLFRGGWLVFYCDLGERWTKEFSCLCIIVHLLYYCIFKVTRISRYYSLAAITVVIFLNIIVIAHLKYALYFTASFILGFICLTSLGTIPESDFSLFKRKINTRFFKRIKKNAEVQEDEVKREREISALSVLVGIIVAYLFNADFFTIISNLGNGHDETLRNVMTWDSFPFSWLNNGKFWLRNGRFAFENFVFQPPFAFGLLLTGFFLSFGSKFFHDLLETLFYAKKAKEAILDPRTYEKTDADAVNEWVNNYDLQNFYYKEKASILSKPEVSAVGIGSIKQNGNWISGIKIYSSVALSASDSQFILQKENGRIFKVPYEVIISEVNSKASSSDISGIDDVCNEAQPNVTGALTYPVIVHHKTGVLPGSYLLTCYHVVKHPEHRWDRINSDFTEVKIAKTGLGEIVIGSRSLYAEVSLIKVLNDSNINQSFFPGLDIRIKGSRSVDEDDIGRRVMMYSKGKREKVEGFIRSYDFADTIYYDDPQEKLGFKMHKLIEIQGINSGPIQLDGDSGSLLFDEYGYALGIVFAKRDGCYTLAMRIDQALNICTEFGYNVNLTTNIS